MSDNLHTKGTDDKNGLPPLDDMYRPPKKDDMVQPKPNSGLPPLTSIKDEAPYYADGSIPPFFSSKSRDNEEPKPVAQQAQAPAAPQVENMSKNPVSPQNNMQEIIQPQYIQAYATRTFSKQDMLAEEGRKIAKVIGIILMVCSVLSLISSVGTKVDFDKGTSYAVWQLLKYAAPQALNIYLSVCFMKGGNKSRIYFGVIYLLSILAVLAIVVFTVIGSTAFGALTASIVSLGMGILLLIMLPSLALMGFIVWGTLFSKKVKAYCGVLE